VEEILESGEETYYPALHVGSEKSCAVVCMSLYCGFFSRTVFSTHFYYIYTTA